MVLKGFCVKLLVAIMGATLCNGENSCLNLINKTVFVIYAAAPIAFPISFQGFRLAYALIAVTVCIFDQLVDPF